MANTGTRQIFSQDIRAISSSQLEQLGAVGETQDGKKYRYSLAGASNLAAGKLNVARAWVANHTNCTVTAAAAIGATTVTATLGATAASLDDYAEGYMTVNDSTGAGISYKVSGHAAVASAGTITVQLAEPIIVALTTSSKVTLSFNPYKSIIVSPSALAHRAIGVNNVAITAAYYGWVQTKGFCSVLADGITAKGIGLIPSDAVDGAVETEVAGTTSQRVGVAVEATVDAKYYGVNLTIE